MLIDDMIGEVISLVDMSIEELNNRQALINENTQRIIEVGDISTDKELIRQVNDNKRKNNEITSDLIEWYQSRGDLIGLQSDYKNRSKIEEISWESLVERLNTKEEREKNNRYLSLFCDATEKVLDDLGRKPSIYPDDTYDYVFLLPELVEERMREEGANNEE